MDMLEPELQFFLDRTNRKAPRKPRKVQSSVVTRTAATAGFKKGNPFAHTRTGFRVDIGLNVRSGWEANVLRILKSYDIAYEFEPMIFTYPIKRGNRAYTPDIYLNDTEEWIEVKGYFDKASQVKMRRFKKYYPDEFAKLTMVISKSSKASREICAQLGVPTVLFYEELSRLHKPRLVNWEGK